MPDDVVGTYGTFSFALSSGVLTWTYTLNNAAVDALVDGQKAYDVLAVSVADDEGATSTTEVITVTITGANDAPVLDVGGGEQASVLIHGVRFTINAAGAAGNDYEIAIQPGSFDQIRVIGQNNIVFSVGNFRTTVLSRDFLSIWDVWHRTI